MTRSILKSVALAVFLAAGAAPALAQGTAITYQGKLENDGSPVNGPINFQFRLYTAATGGTQVGDTVIQTNATVADGLFTLPLDFGVDPYTFGRPLFLDILVNDPAFTTVFTALGARQRITSAPFSLATRGMNVNAAGDIALLDGAARSIGMPVASPTGNGGSLSILAGDSNPNAAFATLGGDLILEAGSCFNADQPAATPGNVIIRSGGNFFDTGFDFGGLPNGGDIIFEAGAQLNSSVERMRLTQAGALGLGTIERGGNPATAPQYKLHVYGSGTTTSIQAPYGMFETEDGTFGPQVRLKHGGQGGQEWVINSAGSGNGPSGSLLFVRNGSANIPLAISPTDNVGIGTAAPTARLHNAGTTRLDQELQFGAQTWNGTTGTNAKFSRFPGSPTTSSNIYLDLSSENTSAFIISRNGNDRFQFETNGNAFKPGGGAWGVLSDERTKTDIQPMTGTLDKLLKLKGHAYTYKPEFVEDGRALPGTQIGLVAQEVETVFPDWVTTGADGLKQVTERSTTALMVEALRDLRAEKDAEIATKDAQIATLEQRLARIEALLNAAAPQQK
jgi:hypothetical protein